MCVLLFLLLIKFSLIFERSGTVIISTLLNFFSMMFEVEFFGKMIYLCNVLFLILLLFLSCLKFFAISVNNSWLFFLYVMTYTKVCSLLCSLGLVVLLVVFFQQIPLPYLIVLPAIPSGGGLRVILLGRFVRGFC